MLLLAGVGPGPVAVGGAATAVTTIETCETITESGEYRLAGDVAADRAVCLDVTVGSVTISGAGAAVTGTGAPDSVGVRVAPGLGNVTLADLTVAGFETGVLLDGATGVAVRNVSTTGNAFFGVDVRRGGGHLIRGVTADGNFVGINLEGTTDNTVEQVVARNSGRNGVAMYGAAGNRVADLLASDNAGNGVLVRSGSNGNEFHRVTATGNGANGVRVFAATANNDFVDLVADGNDVAGISFQNVVRDNRVLNATARENGEWGYYSADDAANNTITDLDVGTATVSFTGRDVGVRGAASLPTPPADRQAVDGYVDAAAIPDFFDGSSDAPSYLDVTVGYDASGIDESTVAFYRYESETETWTSLASTVDAEANAVTANTTTFGVLAPMAAPADPTAAVEQVIVTMVETEEDLASLDRGQAIELLQAHAAETQVSLRAYADETEGVTVLRSFWLSNAVLLAVDTSLVPTGELEEMEGVTGVFPNNESFAPPPFDGEASTNDGTADPGGTATYGLEQVNATGVWSTYGVRGANVTVAVLDTGIDATHPDLDLYTTDPTDPTYPGGWAEFDETGAQVPGAPYDAGDNGNAFPHGTHVSGTVAGGSASGTAIGVAPDARLLHGGVLMQCGHRCGGTTAQVVAGMEWAVLRGADVVSMSLGAAWYNPGYVGPVRNARALGVFVVAAAGNDGPDTGGSPARVYEAFAVGAANESRGIAWFSSGEVVDARTDWGPFAPEEWPDEYVVPDASAPGVLVVSASPGGGYVAANGTSMATPHVAGVAALVVSAAGGSGSIAPADLEQVLIETARKPAVCAPSCDPREGVDTRYGWGIVDAHAAVERVTLSTGIRGTVTDMSGAPIAGAEVTAGGFTRTTDADGNYTLPLRPGTYAATVDAFGYTDETRTVTVVATSFARVDVALERTLEADLVADAPTSVPARDYVDATFAVRNAENVTVSFAAGNTYPASALTLSVNGREVAPGEELAFPAPVDDDAFTVRVDTTAGTSGDLALITTFGGQGATATLRTGPTAVIPGTVQRVAVVEEFGRTSAFNFTDVMATELGPDYEIDYVKTYELPALLERHAYDVYIVESWGDDLTDAEVREFVDFTGGADVGVVFLDGYESCSTYDGRRVCTDNSDGVDRLSAVTGDPATVDDDPIRHPFYEDATQYAVRVDHPLFAGLGTVGDNVTIHEDLYTTSRIYGYNGTVLADVAVVEYVCASCSTPEVENYAVEGPAVAINETRGHVLLGTMGRTWRVDERDYPSNYPGWTDESYDLVENAVTYLRPVRSMPDAVVESYRLSTTSTRPGDPVTVTATVRNRGSTPAVVYPTLYADLEETVDRVEVAGGETATVAFPAVTFAAPGTYYVTVGDGEDVLAPTAVTVADRANVSVSYAVGTRRVDLNEPLGVTATVTNRRPIPTPAEVVLSADGRVADSRSLVLTPREVRTVAFAARFLTEGNHTVTVNGLPPTTVRATDPCFVADSPGRYVLGESILDSPTPRCVRVTASDVVVDGRGLAVDGVSGAGSVGVLATNVSGTGSLVPIENVTVRNLTVTDWVTGVRFDGVADGRIEGVVLDGVVRGVEVDRSASVAATDVTVTGAHTGIEIRRTDGALVEAVTATEGGTGVAIVQATTNATLRGVTVLNNSVGVDARGDGLDVVDVHAAGNTDGAVLHGVDVVVDGAVVTGSADVGLAVDLAAGASLDDVTAVDNGGEGVRVTRSTGVDVRNVVATGNGRAGLEVDNTDGGFVGRVTATDNGEEGVALSRSDDLTVVGVAASGNTDGGLAGRSLANTSVSRLETHANLDHGVFVDVASNATFDRLDSRGNDGHGVVLWRSTGIRMSNVFSDGNAGDGAGLWAADDNTFRNLTLTNNDDVGLVLEGSSDNEFVTVNASGNLDGAFEATAGSTNNHVVDATLNPTVSFLATDVAVDAVARPPPPPIGLVALGPAIEVTATGTGASFEVAFHYTDAMVQAAGVSESTLAAYLSNGTSWTPSPLPGAGVSVDENRVEGALGAATGFGVVAPLGEPDTTVTTTRTADGTEVLVQNAVAGEPTDVPLDVSATDGVALEGMAVTTNTDTDYTLTVNGSGNAPTGQETLAVGTGTLTFGYLTVDHSVADADVDEVVFRFAVSESTLNGGGTAPSEVTLHRYANGTWEPLPTALVATTGTAPDRTYTFEAVSPGLSAFAIGGARAVTVVGAALDDADVLVGDAVTVAASLENAADGPALATLSLTAGGTVVATATPVVPAGTSEHAVTYAFDAPGRYALAVDGVPAGTVTVREPIPVDALADGSGPVRIGSKGVLVVAVRGGSGFDPSTLDVDSLRLGDAATVPDGVVEPKRVIRTDVDGDGDADLLIQVRISAMALGPETTAVAVVGERTDGTPVYGEVEVRVVGSG